MDFLQPLPLVDAVLLITVLEGLALAAWHRATGAGVAPRDYALNLLSGLCLMVTLRGALAGAAPPWIMAGLAAAGAAHAADLWLRWRVAVRPS
jgi:hypothetical protein